MVFIIAEIGSNWGGKVDVAKFMIHECKRAGVDAVKFQMFHAEELYNESHPYWSVILHSVLTFEKAEELKYFADEIGIDWFCSAFYPEAVDFLEKLGVERYKIASRTIALKDKSSMEVLKAVANTQKPVIVSTGYGYDRKLLIRLFEPTYASDMERFENIKLLYCVPKYPAKDEVFHLHAFEGYDGISDHSLGITASIASVALGASIVEKHVKLSRSVGPDAAFSITVEELKELVEHIRRLEVMLT